MLGGGGQEVDGAPGPHWMLRGVELVRALESVWPGVAGVLGRLVDTAREAWRRGALRRRAACEPGRCFSA
jgi:hypothetical protein